MFNYITFNSKGSGIQMWKRGNYRKQQRNTHANTSENTTSSAAGAQVAFQLYPITEKHAGWDRWRERNLKPFQCSNAYLWISNGCYSAFTSPWHGQTLCSAAQFLFSNDKNSCWIFLKNIYRKCSLFWIKVILREHSNMICIKAVAIKHEKDL